MVSTAIRTPPLFKYTRDQPLAPAQRLIRVHIASVIKEHRKTGGLRYHPADRVRK